MGAGNDVTWNREDSGRGLATVARWVHKFKDAKDAGIPDNIAVLDEPRFGAPTKLTNITNLFYE